MMAYATSRPASRIAILLCLIGSASGCAFLRLQGCSKLAACGELAVYSCENELVCADTEGNTIRSEPMSPQRNRCRVCASD